MDKYDLVLDIIEHPDNFTSEQLAEIFSDSETKEIYNLLCKTDSAIEASHEIDVDAEWQNFSTKHIMRARRRLPWFGSRAASIAVIIAASVAVLAAGIAVTVSVSQHKTEPVAEVTSVGSEGMKPTTDTAIIRQKPANTGLSPIMFEDEPLENIMNVIAAAYHVEVSFNNRNVASLHLYYQLDPTLPLDDVIDQLNTFEQIKITKNDNILNID